MKWILLLAASVFFFSISAQPFWNSAGMAFLPGIALAADDDEMDEDVQEVYVEEEEDIYYGDDQQDVDDPDGQAADIYDDPRDQEEDE